LRVKNNEVTTRYYTVLCLSFC